MTIYPSLLAVNELNLGEEIKKIEEANFKWLHIDIMDGNFVPNLSFGINTIKVIKEMTKLKLDVHLMVDNLESMLNTFIDLKPDNLTVHVESSKHIDNVLRQIKAAGIQTTLALNPGTPLVMVEPLLEVVDQILILCVNPGVGGQELIESSYKRVLLLSEMISSIDKKTLIQVDGGVNIKNASKLKKYGATEMVVGSALFNIKKEDLITRHQRFLETVA